MFKVIRKIGTMVFIVIFLAEILPGIMERSMFDAIVIKIFLMIFVISTLAEVMIDVFTEEKPTIHDTNQTKPKKKKQ